MRIRARSELGLERLLGLAIVEAGNVLASLLQLHQHLRKLVIRRGTGNDRHIRRALEDAFALLLGDAAEHGEALALLVERLVVVQAVEDLLLGLVADGTGVVQDEVGGFFGLDLGVALVLERPDDLFRVVDIHLAAEGFDVEGAGARRLIGLREGRVECFKRRHIA